MRIFTCGNCGQLLYFENQRCERCGSDLGFLPDRLTLAALTPTGDGVTYQPILDGAASVRRCLNAMTANCNWMVPADDGGHCRACALSRRIPDLDAPQNIEPWQAAEAAKRRLIYALLRLELPFVTPSGAALRFDILSDAVESEPVLTGHADGVVTINLAEADSAERERRRGELGEAYRTLLGHFRHEVGHFYWDALVRDGGKIDASRAAFGDETLDYSEAMQRHYANGAPPDWQNSFVSSYATMHPWEDFAETWAHYMHIVDAVDTAEAFGVRVDPDVANDPGLDSWVAGDPYRSAGIENLISAWLPLSYAMNSLNRSLGHADLYPFVLSEPAIAKLGFVHELIQAQRAI